MKTLAFLILLSAVAICGEIKSAQIRTGPRAGVTWIAEQTATRKSAAEFWDTREEISVFNDISKGSGPIERVKWTIQRHAALDISVILKKAAQWSETAEKNHVKFFEKSLGEVKHLGTTCTFVFSVSEGESFVRVSSSADGEFRLTKYDASCVDLLLGRAKELEAKLAAAKPEKEDKDMLFK